MTSLPARFATAPLLALLLSFAMAPLESRADTAGSLVPLPDADRAEIEKYLGKGVVGDAVAAAPLGAPDSYLPSAGGQMSFQVIEVGEDPATEVHSVKNAADPTFSPGLDYTVGERGSAYLQKTADGNLLITGQQDLDNKVLSRFSPGEPLIIAGMKPGESRQFPVDVKVADLSDPTDIDHTGSLTITYTYIGAYKITVPAGTYDAALIRWNYKGSVGPADIEETEYRFISPNAGMIAMIENRHISAMLVYSDKTKLGKLLQTGN